MGSSLEGRQLTILVAAHSGNLSGVETYAEQVACAGAAASHKVTLVAIGPDNAAKLRERIGTQVRILATEPLSRSGWRSAPRMVPTLALGELVRPLGDALRQLGETFDVAHLNHPALAASVRPYSRRVVSGAWFYPHRPVGRMVETWRHTGAAFPKSAGFAAKGLSHYWNDRRGYAASDCVVTPTQLLADQLQAMGIHAVACPPPGGRFELEQRDETDLSRRADGRRRVTMICGDLSHPRKNIAAGIDAVKVLADSGMKIDLELIGGKHEALEAHLAPLASSVRVEATGPLPRGQVLKRLRRTDALVVPSLYEEWGYVATEALLTGTPVVAFPVYPFLEVLGAPLGLCAGDMSPDALARALGRVLDSEPERSRVAASAQERFGAEAIGQRLTAIWSSVPAVAGEPALVGASNG
jgi:glycosyltransferase involved in cell wall biosynthesis